MSRRPQTAADFERAFPTRFESQKELLFHPVRPDQIACDILEIGPGRGDFLFAMAEAHPQQQLVAVEIGKKRYYKLVRRIDERGLQNVLLIQGDARFVIPECIPKASVTSAYILFPDPWPKRRHAFHRLLTAEFMINCAATLKPGGMLTLKTDVGAYADWATQNVDTIPFLEVVSSHAGEKEDEAIETLYEQRRRAAGETIRTLRWRRVATEPSPVR